MVEIKRQSPVRFKARALQTQTRKHWTVVVKYEEEGPGPWLADLCHKARWDFQNKNIGEKTFGTILIPETPGNCAFESGLLVNRMNGTQASIWQIGDVGQRPVFTGCTDVTDATVFLALFGPKTFRITEKLTALDLFKAGWKPPFLLQGPFGGIPCQIVLLEKNDDASGGILITCSRGYAESMTNAILDSGAEFGLRPSGESRFAEWVKSLPEN